MVLDLRTTGLFTAITPLVLGLVMAIYWKSRKVYGGFERWVVANFCLSVGYFLAALRGIIPDFLVIVIGNILIVYAAILVYEGIRMFYARPAFNKWNYLILGVYVCFQVWFTYVDPNINVRIVLNSLALTIFILRSGVELYKASILSKLESLTRGASYLFFATALFPLTRAIYAFVQNEPIDFFRDPLNSWYSLIFIASIVTWTFYFFFLNSARLEMELEIVHAELMELASTDPLTGLYNRRHFFAQADLEFQRAKRGNRHLAFIVMDADNFKIINDNYGHDAGDAVLLYLAALFRREIRSIDLAARFGGDEFIVMLMDADQAQALAVAGRILDVTDQTPVPFDARTLPIRLSAGVSCCAPEDQNLTAVLKRADNALYKAKKHGGNQVRVI